MRILRFAAVAAGIVLSSAAHAESVKITNIGHGYYSGALYVAKQEKLSIEERVKRLKGQRVAMPSANGSGEKMLGVLAKKYGLTLPGDISSVYLGAEAGAYVAAFQRELIDAALPFEPAGVLVQQTGKGKIYLNMMSGEIPEFRDILFIVLATNPDIAKEKPDLLRKVAQVFTDAVTILKGDPKRGRALMAKEYPTMTPETNDEAYATVSQIWTDNGRITEQQARATFAYLQPEGSVAVDFPTTFTNEFLPK
jgi:NitT/TauT family transport system substrate-binding protein